MGIGDCILLNLQERRAAGHCRISMIICFWVVGLHWLCLVPHPHRDLCLPLAVKAEKYLGGGSSLSSLIWADSMWYESNDIASVSLLKSIDIASLAWLRSINIASPELLLDVAVFVL